MPVIEPQELVSILALLLGFLATWRAAIFRKRIQQQSRLLTETNECMEDLCRKLVSLQEKNQQSNTFSNTLNQAELTTRLQKSRLSAQGHTHSMSPPERYRYVHSLAANGMSSQEIASVLSISIHEADQLVNLSRLAQTRLSQVPA
ncbi:MAG: hypothetical protein P4L42_07040 [Desulfocapsaceae bacterium]|nr:hypothetical protein [Desulfocapsaceae bacterium]